MTQEDGLGAFWAVPLEPEIVENPHICACTRVQKAFRVYMIVIIMIMFLICAVNMALTCVNMHNFVECSFLCDVTDRTPPPKTPWTAQDGLRWPYDGPKMAI